jgi:undecaprenyl-diphosphatase
MAWLVFLIALSGAAGNAIEGPWRSRVASFDHAVAMWVHSLSCPAMDRGMGAMSWIGEPAPMAAVTGGVFLYLVLRSRWASAMGAVLTMPGTAVMWLVTSWLVERPRPEYWVSHPGADPGYPGGHVMNAIVVAGVCSAASLPRARHRWQRTGIVILWLGFVGAMALCRVYWCIHFPSDQIAGSLMGLAWVGVALPLCRWTFPGLRDLR